VERGRRRGGEREGEKGGKVARGGRRRGCRKPSIIVGGKRISVSQTATGETGSRVAATSRWEDPIQSREDSIGKGLLPSEEGQSKPPFAGKTRPQCP